MAESPERAAEWDAAAVGATVTLVGPDMSSPCVAREPSDAEVVLLCTRDRGHEGDHVATGGGIVLRRWPS